jgi:UDP-N-acetylmuramoyl-L-alanyl-D-glutamate--2,6-diaminopimelate ligase
LTITNNNNIVFTDNTNEIDENSIFVKNPLNEKYLDSAKTNKPKAIINCHELKNYFDFSSIKIVGITGTNGKTTTAAAIYSLLLDLGYKVALLGTRGFFINDKRVENYTFTTPMQIEMFSKIQIAINNHCTFFITEVSSHAIHQNRICGLDFELKVHTNITSDHLDYHKTHDEYIRVKNSFFSDEGKKLINRDDKNIKINMKNGYSYGLDSPSTYKVQAFSFKDGTNVVLQNVAKMVTFNSNLRGTFNLYNLTAAIASVDLITHNSLDEICALVENFAGVSGRMETLSYNPYIVVDFAHTHDGMESVLESFKDKQIIVVFGAGGDRDRTKRPLMGKVASKYSNHIFITSDNPRFEDPDQIVNDILNGISKKDEVIIELNRTKAINDAIDFSKTLSNSVVLILGKGDEEYQIIYDQKVPLSDKQIVQNYLG